VTGAGASEADATNDAQLAADLLKIHEDSYGATAARAKVHVLDDTVIAFLDGIELMPNEQFLIDNGRSEAVVAVRTQYQYAIETTFRAAVERATGRRVVSFASITKLAPNFVAEIFRLADAKEQTDEDPRGD
jgi:uncharacterized protein YbcI